MKSHVEQFVARSWSLPPGGFTVNLEPVHGGLESRVSRATVTTLPLAGEPRRLIVKELRPGCSREAEVYALLWRSGPPAPAARILGVQDVGDTRYLYLEDVASLSAWPWRDTARAAAVCRELAALHDRSDLPAAVFTWDYETELAASAEATLALALEARDGSGARSWIRMGDLRRVVSALPEIRTRLRDAGMTVIHGDVHPGNVILRANDSGDGVALIDWCRARIGSPLEDLASWLHSLGCWEPQARRRHDTLLQAYLDARRTPRPLSRELRTEYWFASASNGVAGAIRYHIAQACDARAPEHERGASRHALAGWARVIRRTSALVTTSCAR